jgi:RNA polymerase sigma-70 factor (ECF subfamily)
MDRGHSLPPAMSADCSASADDFPPLSANGEILPVQEAAPDGDAALMLEVAGGSERAFTALVHRHQNPLVNFFARMGASSDCEDLAQETFVRLYRYRRRYRPSARFTTFLYHLARNVWADRGRKIARMERLASGFQNEIEIASQGIPERPGAVADIEAALDRLSPKLREVIVLNIYQGLRYQEVAHVLEIPLGTVKSRINLALAALKEVLGER